MLKNNLSLILFCTLFLPQLHAQSLHVLATGDTRGYFFEENVDDKKTGGILDAGRLCGRYSGNSGKTTCCFLIQGMP